MIIFASFWLFFIASKKEESLGEKKKNLMEAEKYNNTWI